jgi:hypothetical protein
VTDVETEQRVVAGRYRLLEPLGSGGMGTVWRADDLVLGRAVAVKEVSFPHGLSEQERDVLRERTRREARAAARLDHPSAVTVYDVVEEGDAPYLVMELVEARTLAEVVREDGPLSPQRTAAVGLDLLGALEAAHAQGIVHRDVKPSNVLVRHDGRVVLTDFGIATSTADSSITHTGLLLGSPAYLAPERARGEALGPESDLWSLGATLFTSVEGKPPFDGGEPLLTVTAVVTGEHAPFAAAGPLEPVLDGLLEKDPAQRLDAAGARRLLREVAEQRPAPSTRVLTAPAAPVAPAAAGTTALRVGDVRRDVAAAPPPRRRAPAWAAPAVAGIALLALVGAGVVALTTGDDPDRAALPAASAPAPREPAPSAEPDEEPPAQPAAQPAEQQPADQDEPEQDAAESSRTVPAGWSTDTGGAGWTVALPPGYRQTRAGEYRQASTGRTLRIETGPGQPDAVADRERQEQSFASRHPSYQRIRIEEVDYRGYEAADWEFTYEGLHVINRVFVVDGVGHSLFFQTGARDFAAAEEDFRGIAQAFEPVGG